jgi:hypothetical protein
MSPTSILTYAIKELKVERTKLQINMMFFNQSVEFISPENLLHLMKDGFTTGIRSEAG